jgi:hypothetical protein
MSAAFPVAVDPVDGHVLCPGPPPADAVGGGDHRLHPGQRPVETGRIGEIPDPELDTQRPQGRGVATGPDQRPERNPPFGQPGSDATAQMAGGSAQQQLAHISSP